MEILGVLLELVFELVVTLAVELGAHKRLEHRAEKLGRPPEPSEAGPVAAGFGYALVGAIAGVFSLLVFPDPLIDDPRLRTVNLLVSPVFAGLAMTALGAWRRRRGDDLLRIDHFAYGFVLALAMGLVRVLAAR